MKIIRNSVIALKFEMFDGKGTLVERGKSPYYYLHGGYQGIFPRVEDALADKDVGEKVRVRLAPEAVGAGGTALIAGAGEGTRAGGATGFTGGEAIVNGAVSTAAGSDRYPLEG